MDGCLPLVFSRTHSGRLEEQNNSTPCVCLLYVQWYVRNLLCVLLRGVVKQHTSVVRSVVVEVAKAFGFAAFRCVASS